MLVSLVYEKQNNLRMIMKMHSLGDCPYWIITYAYFLLISSLYISVFILFGSFLSEFKLENSKSTYIVFLFVFLTQLSCIVIVSGLKIFTLNDYSVQSVFYFIYINLQIALAFFSSIFFSEVKTAAGLNFETHKCSDELIETLASNIMYHTFIYISVIGYIYVFASGLFSGMILNEFHDDNSNSSKLFPLLIVTKIHNQH